MSRADDRDATHRAGDATAARKARAAARRRTWTGERFSTAEGVFPPKRQHGFEALTVQERWNAFHQLVAVRFGDAILRRSTREERAQWPGETFETP
jgi:hypothetical protein